MTQAEYGRALDRIAESLERADKELSNDDNYPLKQPSPWHILASLDKKLLQTAAYYGLRIRYDGKLQVRSGIKSKKRKSILGAINDVCELQIQAKLALDAKDYEKTSLAFFNIGIAHHKAIQVWRLDIKKPKEKIGRARRLVREAIAALDGTSNAKEVYELVKKKTAFAHEKSISLETIQRLTTDEAKHFMASQFFLMAPQNKLTPLEKGIWAELERKLVIQDKWELYDQSPVFFSTPEM